MVLVLTTHIVRLQHKGYSHFDGNVPLSTNKSDAAVL